MARSISKILFVFGCFSGRVSCDLVETVISDQELAEDNECTSGETQCTLNAVQLRAQTKLEERGDDVVDAWGQCGGAKWKGAKTCGDGYSCTEVDKWYSQCKPVGEASTKKVSKDSDDDGEEESEPDSSSQSSSSSSSSSTESSEPVSLPSQAPLSKATAVGPANPIVVRGNFMYDGVTGKRFFAKGVAYNPRNDKYDQSFGKTAACRPGNAKVLSYTEDVQSDEHEKEWSRDLDAIANLGANTVRLYNVDPAKDHTKFMKKAAALGIYVIVPLNGKDWGYLPAFPAPSCYTQDIPDYGNVGTNALSYAKQLVKQFSQFENTLLFTVANELALNDKNGFGAFPCVKALTRDIHRYQKSCGDSLRKVPLIYSDVDMGAPDRGEIAKYMTCELESPDDAVDAYGLNVYSWCDETYPDDHGKDNFQWSPYEDVRKEFKDFPVPLLFTEFGCNRGTFHSECPYKGGRTWPDFKHMVGKDMGQIVSGAVAFQFSMDKEEFGLTLSPGFLSGQNELYLLDNYYALQKVYKAYNVNASWDASPSVVDKCSFVPTDVASLSYSHNRPKCPPRRIWEGIQKQHGLEVIGDWSSLPPTPNAPLSDVNGQAECPAAALSAKVKALSC